MSAGTVAILLLALVALDGRLREEISQRVSTPPAMALEGTAQRVSALTHTLAEAARSRSLAHTPVLIFALAAGALVVLMLRT